jgi:hypothetical protein
MPPSAGPIPVSVISVLTGRSTSPVLVEGERGDVWALLSQLPVEGQRPLNGVGPVWRVGLPSRALCP